MKQLKEECNEVELNKITFEIVGLMQADKEYDDKEKMFMNKMLDCFGITNEKIEKMFEYVKIYMELIRNINKLIY